ncbi:ribonuclease H-like domain-containing protein [Ochromonadaceae sp. CCMP2298]|nr:ribonuclease H-like domain-containing protein [Ochromonadaceae sp. CCMP2298]
MLKGEYVASSTDGWSSSTNVPFVATTCHFINADWELLSLVLSCRKKEGRSRATDHLEDFKEDLEAYYIPAENVVAVVTDTEPTMVAFGRMLQEWCPTIAVHGCADHILEVTTKLTGVLDESAAFGLQSLKKLRDLGKLAADKTLSVEQWAEIATFIAVLHPFMSAQKFLEGEKYVTISLLPAIIWHIREQLIEATTEPANSAHVQETCEKLLESFNKEWGSGVDGTVFTEHQTEGPNRRYKGHRLLKMLAARVDPRSKNGRGLGGKDDLVALDAELLKRMVKEATKTRRDNVQAARNIDLAEPQRRPLRVDHYADLFGDNLRETVLPTNTVTIVASQRVLHDMKAELTLFLSAPALPRVEQHEGGSVAMHPCNFCSRGASVLAR